MAKLFVITGPSGVGKGTLLARLRPAFPELTFPISATTRPPRPGEVDGVNYYFLTDEEFEHRRDLGHFVEWARYGAHYYGTLLEELTYPLGSGRSVVLEIELQGARQIRKRFPDAVTVFIAPPDPEALVERLAKRGTEDAKAVEARLAAAEVEIAAAGEFDHIVVNDDVNTAAAELQNLFAQHLLTVEVGRPDAQELLRLAKLGLEAEGSDAPLALKRLERQLGLGEAA